MRRRCRRVSSFGLRASAPAAAVISWSQPQRRLIVRVVGRPMLPFLLLRVATVLGDPASSRLHGLLVVGPLHTFAA
ncbi:MAG TPA: hypothetical protein VKF37_01370 [Chloroflexota bacterium]|nr:hypothetical protein [Chloroflexota bacterium]